MNSISATAIPAADPSSNGTTLGRQRAPSPDAAAYAANPANRLVIETTEVVTVTEPESLMNGEPAPSRAPAKSTRLRTILVGVAVVLAAVAAGTYYEVFAAPFETTDDAFIAADVTPIAPQIAGRVDRLLVADNQPVQQGQLLLEIDPRDFQAKADQARAILAAAHSRLEQARAQFAVDQAKTGEEQANVAAATAQAAHAAADAKRFEAVGTLGVSDSQLDLASTQARSSAADLEAARSKLLAAQAQERLDQANIATATAAVAGVEAAVRQAALDLSYTRVTAPVAGIVTHRSVEPGAYVQAGQSLLAIVPREVWVVANFKETQLAHMSRGQPVDVTVDAYPQLKLQGHVDSIQAGSGATFSLLPPENATGNYVKVVQRVPVKIVLDHVPGAPFVLGPGMSVVPEVRVR
jgi:membrane fusion protein, multidrug efflux system